MISFGFSLILLKCLFPFQITFHLKADRSFWKFHVDSKIQCQHLVYLSSCWSFLWIFTGNTTTSGEISTLKVIWPHMCFITKYEIRAVCCFFRGWPYNVLQGIWIPMACTHRKMVEIMLSKKRLKVAFVKCNNITLFWIICFWINCYYRNLFLIKTILLWPNLWILNIKKNDTYSSQENGIRIFYRK